LKGFAPEKWGQAVRATVKTPRETVKMLRASVKMLRATVNALGATVKTLREIVKVVGATVDGLRDWGRRPGKWGHRPENRRAPVSRRVWGTKILRSGCERFARWLAM